jgi:hypothetical protein
MKISTSRLKEIIREEVLDENILRQIKQAEKIAKSMAGNMTGAVKGIEKIRRGLSRHKRVKIALQKYNESVNEDGHTDVASAKRKAMLMVEYSKKLLNTLNGMNKEDSLPSWLSDKITLASDYLHKATHYLLNPVESVTEHTVTFTKDDMEKLHSSGEVIKSDPDGKEHTYVYKEYVKV